MRGCVTIESLAGSMTNPSMDDLVNWAAWALKPIGTAGGIGAVLVGLKKVAEIWVAQQFKKEFADYEQNHRIQLESVRHERDKDITALKADLEYLKDRLSYANEKEFSAIDELWNKYIETHSSVKRAIFSYIQFPDLNRLSESEVEEFLNTTCLDSKQKNTVMTATDKVSAFSRQMRIIHLNDAAKNIYDLNNLIMKNSIYIPDILTNEFKSALDFLNKHNALEMTNFQFKTPNAKEQLKYFEEEGKVFEKLRAPVRDRVACERL